MQSELKVECANAGRQERLRAYVAARSLDNEVVDVDFLRLFDCMQNQWEKVSDAIQEGKVLALNVSGYAGYDSSYDALAYAFVLFSMSLQKTFMEFFLVDEYIAKRIKEVLKNAFYHGNKLNFSLPIFIYFDLGSLVVEVYDLGAEGVVDLESRKLAERDFAMGGHHLGISQIDEEGKWRYRRIDVIDPETKEKIGGGVYLTRIVQRVISHAWHSIQGNILDYDPTVAQKNESFIARLYHSLARILKGLDSEVEEGMIDPLIRLQLSQHGPEAEIIPLHEVDRELKVGFLPIAANPLNWGHLLTAFIGMKVCHLDTVVIRVQGEIPRENPRSVERAAKKLSIFDSVTASDRHAMAREVIRGTYPLLRYTDLGSEPNNHKEGFQELIRFLDLNRDRRMHVTYLLGIENEKRLIYYFWRIYQEWRQYHLILNPNHRITFGWIQRGSGDKTVTQIMLNELDQWMREETKSTVCLDMKLIQDPENYLNVSSVYYLATQDGASVPRFVHEQAIAKGLWGNPPIDRETGKPIVGTREEWFRMGLAPVVSAISREILARRATLPPDDLVIVSIDGGSATGKSTIAEEIAASLRGFGIACLILHLEMFLKDRTWRLTMQRLVVGLPLSESEKDQLGTFANGIIAGKVFVGEECFFDDGRILEVLLEIDAFRHEASARQHSFVVEQAFDQQTKSVQRKAFQVSKGMVILVEGKYANTESLQGYYDLGYRLRVDPEIAEARFQIRSRNLSPDDADMQVIFYSLSLEPSYELYAKRTEAAIHSFVDLQGDCWLLRKNEHSK